MLVTGALVAVAAPQFLTTDNLSNVAVLASITAIAAIGQALVVITRNIDLSVESVMGLVAYGVAITLETHTLDASGALVMGVLLGLGLGMVNGVLVAVLRVPSIVATLGTLSIFRGIDYLIAGSHQVPLAGLPPGFTDAAHSTFLGLPIFVDIAIVVALIATVILRWTRFGRQVYAVGSNPEAAAILGIPSRLVVFVAFAVCGMLAGVAGILWVVEFGTINGTSANGVVLAVVAAVVVGGVNIFGGSGTVIGAAIGALFLGFVANALILVGLSQFWLQAIYGVVILVAVSADALIGRRLQRLAAERRVR
jgi:rhamnose transport system permease protein